VTTHHFIVARADSSWKVSFHGTDQGPYMTKDAAIAAAVAAAQAKCAEGILSEVLVQDIESNFHTAWTSGQSPESGEALSSSA